MKFLATARLLLLKGIWLVFVVLFTLPAIARADKYDSINLNLANENYTAALNELVPLVEEGDAYAQGVLGNMYSYGLGVQQDRVEGVRLLRLSAEQGVVMSWLLLAEAYENGWGVVKSYEISFGIYSNFAHSGNELAQAKLSEMYFDGNVVPRDLVLSHMWANLASANGGSMANRNLEVIEALMSPLQIEQAMQRALVCQRSGYTDC